MQCIMQCILCYYSKCCDKISCNPHSREWFSWFTQMNDSNDAAVKFQREIHTAIRLGPIPHHEDLDDLLVGQCFHLSVTMDSPRHQGLVRHQHQLPGLWMISIRHEFHVSKFASNNSSLASFAMPNATEPDALMELFLSALKPVNDCELLFSFHIHPHPKIPKTLKIPCLERCVESVQPSSAKLAFGTTAPHVDLPVSKHVMSDIIWLHIWTL